jgi:hypothetical protein
VEEFAPNGLMKGTCNDHAEIFAFELAAKTFSCFPYLDLAMYLTGQHCEDSIGSVAILFSVFEFAEPACQASRIALLGTSIAHQGRHCVGHSSVTVIAEQGSAP